MKMMHFDCSRINRIFFRQVMPSSFLSQESISLSKNYNWYVFDQSFKCHQVRASNKRYLNAVKELQGNKSTF